MQLKVPFSEIPEHGIECEIKDSSWLPEEFMEQAGPVAIHIRLTKKNDNRIELQGSLQVGIFLECDRCLQPFMFQVASPMQLLVEVGESSEHWKLQDIEPTAAQLETVVVERPVVELADLFQEQLFLALPVKRLCMENCSGLCAKCGANLNEKKCDCAGKSENSPFAVLGGLKIK